MMRRWAGPRGAFVPLLAAVALAVGVPTAVQGQVAFGIHAARTTRAVNGAANGVGASLAVGVPVLPVHVVVSGDWFRPTCAVGSSGCSYMGGGVDLQLALPFPVVQPYALGGVVIRRSRAASGAATVSNRGLDLGAGVNLRGVVVGLYGEVRYEFVTPDHPVVFRIGIRF